MPNRREFLGAVAGAATAAALAGCAGAVTKEATTKPAPTSAPAAPKPTKNLLIITADDLNCDSVGWMGSKVGATPNIDAFAKTAYCNANAHSAAPICQPSREAIMTGRVPHRSGGLGFDPVNADCPTLWESMKAAGYFTVGIHKLPHMAPPGKFNWDWRSDAGKKNEETGRNPPRYFEEVTEGIQRAKKEGKLFFINANINDPHRPFYGTDRDKELDGIKIDNEFKPADIVIPPFLDEIPDVRKEVCQYFNSVRRFDQSFGHVIRALQASGEAENTVVVFVSDHGMSFPFAKTTIYQNGTWTPMMIRAPGVSKPMVDHQHVVGNIDIMPTVLDLLGVARPDGMDGRTMLPLLSGSTQADRGHVFTHMTSQVQHLYYPSRCVRTKESAYIFNTWSDGKMRFKNESQSGLTFKAMETAAAKDPKLQARVKQFLYRTPEEFYDLKADRGERNNLIKDGERKEEIDRLKALLLAQMKQTNDPLLKDFQNLMLGGRA